MKFISDQSSATRQLGARIGAACTGGECFLLYGELGAGKTTLTQGIAKALGITRNVTSPTFTMVKEYQGRLPLIHIDAYRLEGISQDLGFGEYWDNEGVCVIEWPQYLSELPSSAISITLKHLGEDRREIILENLPSYLKEALL
ncbi:MAG: tRNA (adenosine(37)-N6)-threonylcarbamoyltransferase complex ATPase subunit type 1 TsaE [Erysipelotrichaceae bacterium]|jgi:tRNA threonylcarbamoyladenosine biosynthesis protein TsaE|nr:tRNA (adenosine(37)-N6)-threonylcarbamoyltransferase complex ATPase subunit type 1 TsaE [Erysipelotrichaceae bacterium]